MNAEERAKQRAAIAMLICGDPVIGLNGTHALAPIIRTLVYISMLGVAFNVDYDAERVMQELEKRLLKYHVEEQHDA